MYWHKAKINIENVMILVAFHIYEGLRDRAFSTLNLPNIRFRTVVYPWSFLIELKKRPKSGAPAVKEL